MNEPTQPHAEGLLTIEGLAAALHCTVRHIDNLRRQGLPSIRVGRLVRFELRQVLDFLAKHGGTRPSEATSTAQEGPR